jgi:glycosyltransferase involved in cell wall biosynthesis
MAASEPSAPAPAVTVPVIAEGLFSFQFGGSERVGADLALEFHRRGYRVVCFAFHGSHGPIREHLERSGIRCLDLNYQTSTGIFRRVSYAWKFWRMLRREQVRALHVHHHGALILCGIAAKLAGIKHVVMTEHDLQALRERPTARKLAVRYSRYADDITLVDPGQVEYFRTELRLAASKLHYVANGIRIVERTSEGVEHARHVLGVPSDVFAFFFVGRLSPVKDLGTLLDAFARLSPAIQDRAHLYVVGDGSERAGLEAQRAALGLRERVTFLGARSEVGELLLAADAFVMSSKSEGLPMVLLEAMAVGVPCVATAVGGIPQLFGDDRGLMVPAQDAAALANAMERVAGSPDLRARLAAQALANLRANYALDPIVDQYLKLLGLPPRIGVDAI